MGLGLQNAYGAQALQQELRQRILDQIDAQQRARKVVTEDRDFAQRQEESKQRAEIQKAQLESITAQRESEIEQRKLGLAEKVGGAHLPGDLLGPEATGALKGGLMGDTVETQSPTLPARDLQGAPSLQVRGRMVASDPGNEQPQDWYKGTGAQRQVEEKKQLRGRYIGSLPQGSQEARSAAYLENMGHPLQAGALVDPQIKIDADRQRQEDKQENMRLAASLRPPPAAAADKLVKVEHRDENGRTVIEWLPQSEVRGRTFQKGVGATAESRLQSAQAVNQTGNDIMAQLKDPAFAATVGPEMGRFSSLQDFIGNPPPQFSELAGAIESYALANMGVHGMRSAQGAEQIKTLLSGKHTPESLIAAIQGLQRFSQHFMENEGRSVGSSGPSKSGAPPTAPAGWKYVAKPGGGWTAVEDKKP